MLDLDIIPDDSPLSLTSPSAANPNSTKRRRAPLPVHRCRFPDWSPSAVAALAITPTSFDASLLACGGVSGERGVLGVGRANGDVELMVWGGHQGWISWRTLPSSFPLPSNSSNSRRKPTSLLSHLTFTHQTTLSPSDLALYSDDPPAAEREALRLSREGVRLFGVGGSASELVEWEWGGPGAKKEIGRVKSTLPTLPPIFALAASRAGAHLAIGCEDSTIRILNILDDELELVAKIDVGGPGKVRALSLAWGPPVPASESKGKSRADSPEPASSLPAKFATPTDSYLIAGCSNSSIRRFDAPPSAASSGSLAGAWRASHKMTLDRLKGEHTVVWAVLVLADGAVVSADSMGHVAFWDGRMGTQTQSFKSHKADVLCLAVGSDGTSVFSSGVDQKTTEFKLVTVGSARAHGSAAPRWIQSSGRRLHSHDVRALVVSPPYSPALPNSRAITTAAPARQVPILTSGGLDLSLIIVAASSTADVHPARPLGRAAAPKALPNPVSDSPSTEFEATIHRRAAYVPQRARPFAIAAEGRLLVGRRERELGIWQLEQPRFAAPELGSGKSGWKVRQEQFGLGLGGADKDGEEEVASTPGWVKVGEMALKLQTNLIASAVSADGKWLAVSDLYETKLFRLSLKNGELVPRRQKTFSTSLSSALPPSLGTGSSALTFTRDSQRLILATSFGSTIAVVQLSKDGEFEVAAVFTQHSTRTEGDREIINGKVPAANGNGNGNGHANGNTDGDVSMESDPDSDSDAEAEETPRAKVGDKPATVALLAVSNDGQWLASADVERKVCVFDLHALAHHSTLPTPAQVPSALAFLPTSPSVGPTLLLGLPSNALSLFDLGSRRFHSWALPLASLRTNTLMDLREPLLGVQFEPRDEALSAAMGRVHESRRQAVASEPVAVLWGANWVAKIDLDEVRLGAPGRAGGKRAPVRREFDRKRAREEEDGVGGVEGEAEGEGEGREVEIRLTRRYQPLVLFDFVGVGELVAVERTWFDIAKALPPAFSANGQFAT